MAKPQYGADHQRRRRHLLPKAYGTPCPMCGHTMLKGQALDLDHSLPVALGGSVGDRMSHRKCNRAAGARLGAARRKGSPPAQTMPTSRAW